MQWIPGTLFMRQFYEQRAIYRRIYDRRTNSKMTAEERARQQQEVSKQNAGDEWETLESYFEVS